MEVFHITLRACMLALRDVDTDTLGAADELVPSQLLVRELDAELEQMSARLRTCPGRYWRAPAAVQDAMRAWNAKCKRQKLDASADCAAAKRGKGLLRFASKYRGPGPGAPLLCDSCGHCLRRDIDNEFVRDT